MSMQKDQFQATTFWNSFLAYLNTHFKNIIGGHLTGNAIYNISFEFFKKNSKKQVTKEKIEKLCQLLLDTFIIYEVKKSSTDISQFKVKDSIKYGSYAADRETNIGSLTNLTSLESGDTSNKTSIFGENVRCESACLERRLAMMRLLKYLDISMIQGLVDLCQLSDHCSHSAEARQGWSCKYLESYTEDYAVLKGDCLLQMHYNCITTNLTRDYTKYQGTPEYKSLVSSSLAKQLPYSDRKLIALVQYLSVHPEVLRWSNLTEVLYPLSLYVKDTCHHDLLLQCLQLAFNLLPDVAQHFSYHMVHAMGMLMAKVTDPETRRRLLYTFGDCLLIDHSNKDNLHDDSTLYPRAGLTEFIVNNYETVLTMPEDLRLQVVFLKEHADVGEPDNLMTPVFTARVSVDEAHSNSALVTDNCLRQYYYGLKYRHGHFAKLSDEEVKEKLKAFTAMYKSLHTKILEEEMQM